MTDIVIGEATLELLLSDKAISSRALMDVLQRMAEDEADEERQQVIARAIQEVQQNLSTQSAQSRVTLRDRNNTEHHFKGEAMPGDKRKH
ncbi:MAG: hypothetical protein MIK83_01620 [Pantoea piersonii]|uniref:Uncharacterized protein n=1 Tax=Pantoea piersonii TaxID=2364647 RepID=A0AAJ5QMB7_9GAMM|nr:MULTISPECIES: hypothetical protein [Pantoea]MDU6432558.1 hypothetical protein [Pantoea sp.]MBZ6384512.1 hypothetical protein [Pantoea piersonii]MBZ6398313.1 hypothetical protein [Pantoea piersonii]MBZ6425298.1 hypothetical protein [Pantoea piersonii]NYB07050.1 hypothetical protein [Pantoea piersonii]